MKNILTNAGIAGATAPFALAFAVLFGWQYAAVPIGFMVALKSKRRRNIYILTIMYVALCTAAAAIKGIDLWFSAYVSDATAHILIKAFFVSVALGAGIGLGLFFNRSTRKDVRAVLE